MRARLWVKAHTREEARAFLYTRLELMAAERFQETPRFQPEEYVVDVECEQEEIEAWYAAGRGDRDALLKDRKKTMPHGSLLYWKVLQ